MLYRRETELQPCTLRLRCVKANATDVPPGRVCRRARSCGLLRGSSGVAVLAAVLIAALTACGAQGPPPPCGALTSPQPSGWAGDPGAIASDVASGLVPPYYVAVNDDGADAFVQATATGRKLATIFPPAAGGKITAVTAAPGDRTFIVGEAQWPSNVANAFYLFRVSSSGRPGALRRLPVSVPGGETADGFALSPYADKLAVAVVSGPADQEFGIEVYTLATGAVRIWTASTPATVAVPGGESTLSWTQDERTLSFPWGPGRSAASSGTRLLSLNAPGRNLLTASRAAPAGTGHGWACSGIPVITPDGKTLACGAVSSANSAASIQVAGVAEYDAASGRLERVLGQHQSGPQGALLWWENTSGSVLIGGIVGPFDSCPMALPPTVGVFTGSRFVALPGMPEPLLESFAW
jgi:hypothetical protein